jgi:hypothetical protein
VAAQLASVGGDVQIDVGIDRVRRGLGHPPPYPIIEGQVATPKTFIDLDS